MADATGGGPKCLLDVQGKPFIVRQLEWLAQNGVTGGIVWLNTRHLDAVGHATQDMAPTPQFWFHHEAERSGTGGALQKLAAETVDIVGHSKPFGSPLLDETFLVIMGDVMLPGSAVPLTIPEWADAAMLVTDGARDARNVACDGERVTEYTRSGGLTHTDAGAWLVRKRLVEVDHDMPWDFEDCVLPWSVRFQAVAAVHTHEEPMHVGTPEGLERARELWSSHTHHCGSQ